MDTSERLRGLTPAPFTPMRDDGSIHLDAIDVYAELLVRNGIGAAFVCGTTGEGMSMSVQERSDVAQRWVDVAPEGFRVIVHVGHTSQADCKALADHARRIGAWGVGAMGPCFFRPAGVGDLVDFCADVAAAAGELPFYYYHIPSMTGVSFPMVEFLEAAGGRIPNLAGIKYTWEDLMDFELCRAVDGGRFDILFGRDEILLCGLALGARGAIGSTFSFAAPLYRRIIDAFGAGDLATARAEQRRSMEMIRALCKPPGAALVTGKAIMKRIGVDCGPVRSPVRNLSDEELSDLNAALDRVGFDDFCCT